MGYELSQNNFFFVKIEVKINNNLQVHNLSEAIYNKCVSNQIFNSLCNALSKKYITFSNAHFLIIIMTIE